MDKELSSSKDVHAAETNEIQQTQPLGCVHAKAHCAKLQNSCDMLNSQEVNQNIADKLRCELSQYEVIFILEKYNNCSPGKHNPRPEEESTQATASLALKIGRVH